jgi:hypothetical protein
MTRCKAENGEADSGCNSILPTEMHGNPGENRHGKRDAIILKPYFEK